MKFQETRHPPAIVCQAKLGTNKNESRGTRKFLADEQGSPASYIGAVAWISASIMLIKAKRLRQIYCTKRCSLCPADGPRGKAISKIVNADDAPLRLTAAAYICPPERTKWRGTDFRKRNPFLKIVYCSLPCGPP